MFYERTQGKRRTLPSVRRAKCAARLAYNTSGTHWRRTGKRVAYLNTSGARYTQAAHRVPPCGGLWRWFVCRVPLQLVRLAAACVCAAVGVSLRPVRMPFISVFSAYNCGVRTVENYNTSRTRAAFTYFLKYSQIRRFKHVSSSLAYWRALS